MRCFECGEENPSDGAFCQKCGRRLTPSDTADIPQMKDDDTREATPASEEFVDGAYRYSIYDKDKTFVFCPMCGRRISPSVEECNFCGYNICGRDTAKKKSRKGIIAIVAAIAAALVLAAWGMSFALSNLSDGIKGSWQVQQDSMGVFGLLTESYMVVDDDTVEYYGSFSVQEYEYDYNPITKTLTLYDDAGNKESLHLKWADKDTFTIRENGDTYTRLSDFDDGTSDEESESTI